MIDTIRDYFQEKSQWLIEVRRHLHQNPELSFQEENTSAYIRHILEENMIEYTHPWAGHGILAVVRGAKPGPTRALRADMDALPIQESNEVEYKSNVSGVMHACGHDVHTTCMIGAMLFLNANMPELEGDVYFIFQPAEEKLPGGAKLMIEEGILEKIKAEFIIAQHVLPELECGKLGLRSGRYMASADEIYISLKGVGGHAALPQKLKDPIVAAAQIILALQNIVSRNADPFIPSVLSIGKLNTIGGATNVIPDEIKMEGTFRTMDESWRTQAHDLIRSTVKGICESYGVECIVNIEVGYPCVHNHEVLTDKVHQKLLDFHNQEDVIDLSPRMTAEDFAYFSQKVPVCFYRLGTGNEKKGIKRALHTPTFDVDEDAINIGAATMAWLAWSVRL
jgi:amidohydrolase